MATIPAREAIAIKAVATIIDQVDVMRIYLNNFDEIPSWCMDNDKIEAHLGNLTDLNASGKFFWANKNDEYYFTIDDDILYPEGYTDTVKAIYKEIREDIKRPVAISFHGKVMKEVPIEHYFTDIAESVHCLNMCERSRYLHIIGTGVGMIDTSVTKIDIDKFKYLFMDDIEVSKQLQEQGTALVGVSHADDTFRYMDPGVPTLWDQYHEHDEKQTELYNSGVWILGGKDVR